MQPQGIAISHCDHQSTILSFAWGFGSMVEGLEFRDPDDEDLDKEAAVDRFWKHARKIGPLGGH